MCNMCVVYSKNKQVRKRVSKPRRPSTTQLTLDEVLHCPTIIYTNNKLQLETRTKIFYLTILDDLLKKKGNKAAPVDYNQSNDPLPFHIIYTTNVVFKIMECLFNHKSTILVHMI